MTYNITPVNHFMFLEIPERNYYVADIKLQKPVLNDFLTVFKIGNKVDIYKDNGELLKVGDSVLLENINYEITVIDNKEYIMVQSYQVIAVKYEVV